MRDGQARSFLHQIIIEENVDVDHSRTKAEGRLPAQFILNVFDLIQQSQRSQIRFSQNHLIQELGLLGIPDRFGFLDGRKLKTINVGEKRIDRLLQVPFSVPHVRP